MEGGKGGKKKRKGQKMEIIGKKMRGEEGKGVIKRKGGKRGKVDPCIQQSIS